MQKHADLTAYSYCRIMMHIKKGALCWERGGNFEKAKIFYLKIIRLKSKILEFCLIRSANIRNDFFFKIFAIAIPFKEKQPPLFPLITLLIRNCLAA